jgi:hypothetical protein
MILIKKAAINLYPFDCKRDINWLIFVSNAVIVKNLNALTFFPLILHAVNYDYSNH